MIVLENAVAIELKVQLNLVFMFSCFFFQQKFIAGPPIFVVIYLYERIWKPIFFHICSQPNQIKMPKKETFGSVIYLAYNPILIFSLSENCCLMVIIINKVNRCLARYSPRHTHQPTHQQGTKWVSNGQKCQFRAQFDRFGAKNPFLLLEKSKVLLPT